MVLDLTSQSCLLIFVSCRARTTPLLTGLTGLELAARPPFAANPVSLVPRGAGAAPGALVGVDALDAAEAGPVVAGPLRSAVVPVASGAPWALATSWALRRVEAGDPRVAPWRVRGAGRLTGLAAEVALLKQPYQSLDRALLLLHLLLHGVDGSDELVDGVEEGTWSRGRQWLHRMGVVLTGHLRSSKGSVMSGMSPLLVVDSLSSLG